ncbi:MAG: ROK family protein [Acidobacteria bacterium]|nr:ROK family protein [Acidobacteriota bacterium]MBS1865968.1 ROK family protein [Acidobacteriota bacterium]
MPSKAVGNDLFVGVDVGGTKVAAGIVDSRGKILAKTRAPMNCQGTEEEGFASVISAIESLFTQNTAARRQIHRIGICAPGPLDPRTGVIINPPNLPCWRDFPLADEVAKRYSAAVKVNNDANAAGLAEYLWGVGRGVRNVFYGTLGTGIGSGIILDGKIFHGRTGSAAEGGHVTIDLNGPVCNCGKKGCIEILASGTAIARRARERIAQSPQLGTQLLALAGGEVSAVRSEMVGKAAQAGDPLAKEILAQTSEYLAIWLGNIVDLLEPEMIILGGGAAEMLRPCFGEIQKRMKNWCVNSRYLEIPIVPAFYGENAGIAGGAALCISNSLL